MSEHTMSVRCIHCGTDKPPLMSAEYEDAGPWKCCECGESGFKEDFFVLQPPDIQPLKLKDMEDAVSLLNEAFEKGKREGIEEGRQAGIKEEREATIRYFKKVGKPYYVALFREGEHLK